VLSEYQPYLVCMELNEKIPPPIKFSVNYSDDYYYASGSHFYGFSIQCLEDILSKYGYDLVKVQYNNCYIIKSELNTFGSVGIADGYRDGYTNNTDKKKHFWYNKNVDCLQQDDMPIEKKLKFIDNFFEEHVGKYSLEI